MADIFLCKADIIKNYEVFLIEIAFSWNHKNWA